MEGRLGRQEWKQGPGKEATEMVQGKRMAAQKQSSRAVEKWPDSDYILV